MSDDLIARARRLVSEKHYIVAGHIYAHTLPDPVADFITELADALVEARRCPDCEGEGSVANYDLNTAKEMPEVECEGCDGTGRDR